MRANPMTPSGDKPKRMSLWRETLSCFGRHWKPWLKLAVWFMAGVPVLFGAFGLGTFLIMGQNPMGPAGEGANATVNHLPPMPPGGVAGILAFTLAMAGVIAVQYYLFNMFFLSREKVFAKELRSSHGGFWYYVGQRILAGIVTVLPPMLLGIAVSILMVPVAKAGAPVKGGTAFLTFVVLMIAYLASIYLAFRYFLVGVLACGNIKATLKTSWALTNGNWWRLVGNMLLLYFLMLLILAVFNLALGEVARMFPPLAVAGMIVMFVYFTVIGGMLSAFGATALRILYHERRQAEPGFVLVSRG